MADVDQAIAFVLREEDAALTGAITDRGDDLGGRTRFGMAEKWHPALAATTFYSSMQRGEALALAEATLDREYVRPMWLDQVVSQVVANAWLSFAVNAGQVTAALWMQRALNRLQPNAVTVDGMAGSATIAAVNRCMEASLLGCFRVEMAREYVRICDREPAQRVFLLGWMHRVLA